MSYERLETNNGLDVWEHNVDTEGFKGRVRIIFHPTGRGMVVDVTTKHGKLSPTFVQACLYDAAGFLAEQEGLVETIRNLKRGDWS